MTQLPRETKELGHTNKSKSTNEHTKHKPRLNTQKNTQPNRAVWTGPGSCAQSSNIQPKCQGPLQLLSPPFLMTTDQHHKTDEAKRKGGCLASLSQGKEKPLVIKTRMEDPLLSKYVVLWHCSLACKKLGVGLLVVTSYSFSIRENSMIALKEEINTLTVSAILGQTRLHLLNPKSQLSKIKVHLQPKQTVLFPFTRWQHVYYILETWQAALVRRWSGALCYSMRDVYTRMSCLH